MVDRLDPDQRDILEFRPNIHFVEPEVQPGEILAEEEDPQLEDIEDARREVKQLANAVNVLATALQKLADEKARGLVINLDPKVDPGAVSAMTRKFPDADPTKITYDQYAQVKEDLRKFGEETGKKAIITPDEVSDARDDADKAQQNIVSDRISTMGGFNTPDARSGALRPEVNSRAQVIPPLNIPEIQISLICILANFIWKNFVVAAFKPIKIPFAGSVAKLLPKKICNPGANIELPGLFMLGDPKVPDILSGKAADVAATALET
jgi:hypothetical protein